MPRAMKPAGNGGVDDGFRCRSTHPTVFQREAMEKMSGLKGVKSMDSSFAYLFKGLDEGRMAKIRAIGKEIAVKSGQQRFRKGEEAKIFLGEL